MLKEKMESIFGEADKMMQDMYKAAGINILDAVGSMDEDTGSLMVSTCRMYAKSKELSLEAASMMDEQRLQMDQLLEMNKKLIEQTLNLQEEQRLLIKKIEKLEQGNTCKCSKEK